MAAFIFTIGGHDDEKEQAISKIVSDGVYSTFINEVKPGSSTAMEATLADYLTMKPGDDVYFFAKRKIYGIGKLKAIGPDCKYNNYIGASRVANCSRADVSGNALVQYGNCTPNYRWICLFMPSPKFYKDGLDMDEVLKYKPYSFKMLRAFWKRSFIKLDDEEATALREVFLIRHQARESYTYEFNDGLQKRIELRNLQRYQISPCELVESSLDGNGLVKHEMAVEASLIHTLTTEKKSIFGKWDYVSHQVVASPQKPVDYMDKIDVLAMRYIQKKVVGRYLVAEIKKVAADRNALIQLMEYVDWCNSTYAFGDYELIEACIVAPSFDASAVEALSEFCKRVYLRGSHPAKSQEWRNVKLVKYVVGSHGTLEYELYKDGGVG